jgi:hypothetical protein
MPPKTYYEILGIATTASRDEIKRAYRALARQYHPDARPGDPQASDHFREITAAYQTLINIEKRAAYDASLATKSTTTAPNTPPTTTSSSVTTTSRKAYAQTTPDDKTHTAIRWIFMGVLATLFIVLAQVLLFLDSPTPNRIDRSAANTERTPTATATSTLLPELARENIPPLTTTALATEALATCTFVLDDLSGFCDAIETMTIETESDLTQIVIRIPPGQHSRIGLRVDYNSPPTGWTVNIGNSPRNTGTQGDGRTGTDDAQISIFERDLLVYGNEGNDNAQLVRVQNVLATDTTQLFIVVGSGEIVWSVGDIAERLTSRYLFMPTTDAGPLTFFAAFNRTIGATGSREGAGVVAVQVWLIP